MTEKAYFLDEARDVYIQTKNKFLKNKPEDIIYYMISCLIKGGIVKKDIVPLIQEMSILCDPFSMSQETRDNIDKAIDLCLNDGKHFNIAEEVRNFCLSSNGIFSSSDVVNCLSLSSRKDKQHVSNTLGRLIKEGLIERYGNKNGHFRLIDRSLDLIDWTKDPGEEIDISLPFGLNKLVKIYPRNLIVIAGMSNAGKTAFLLNIVKLNLDKFKNKINYFSSEMGACELKIRLEKFKLSDEIWKFCNFWERSEKFADVINPDIMNIIDYFEINDSFWQIGGDFKLIADKLNKGIAIVALQKHPEKDEGSGGRFSLEKPRLYLSLNEIGDFNEIKIVKAKNWRDETNPNKLIKNFKIKDGYQLIEMGSWHRKEK